MTNLGQTVLMTVNHVVFRQDAILHKAVLKQLVSPYIIQDGDSVGEAVEAMQLLERVAGIVVHSLAGDYPRNLGVHVESGLVFFLNVPCLGGTIATPALIISSVNADNAWQTMMQLNSGVAKLDGFVETMFICTGALCDKYYALSFIFAKSLEEIVESHRVIEFSIDIPNNRNHSRRLQSLVRRIFKAMQAYYINKVFLIGNRIIAAAVDADGKAANLERFKARVIGRGTQTRP